MNEIKLNITGMTCEHCVRAVTRALKAVPGVQDAQVTLQPGSAIVKGEADQTALILAISREGYEAEVAS